MIYVGQTWVFDGSDSTDRYRLTSYKGQVWEGDILRPDGSTSGRFTWVAEQADGWGWILFPGRSKVCGCDSTSICEDHEAVHLAKPGKHHMMCPVYCTLDNP